MSASPKKKSAPAEHPKYIDMISAAITSLKERKGSSRQAIVKFVKANYKVGENADVHVKMALKRGVTSGALTQLQELAHLVHSKSQSQLRHPRRSLPPKTCCKETRR